MLTANVCAGEEEPALCVDVSGKWMRRDERASWLGPDIVVVVMKEDVEAELVGMDLCRCFR